MTGRRSTKHNTWRTAARIGGGAVLAVVALAGCTREPERSVAAFCAQVRDVDDIDEVLASGDPGRTTEELAGLRELRESSPPEIEPHVATLVGVTEELAEAMAQGDAAAAAGDVFARHKGNLPTITAAGQAVERYTTEHCSLTLNPSATVPPATVAPPPEPTTTTTSASTSTTRAATTSTRSSASTSTSRRSSTTGSTTTTRRSSTTTRRATTTTR